MVIGMCNWDKTFPDFFSYKFARENLEQKAKDL